MKIIHTQGARARGEPEDSEVEFVLPNDTDDVELVPRIDVNSVVGNNSEVLDWELQNNESNV